MGTIAILVAFASVAAVLVGWWAIHRSAPPRRGALVELPPLTARRPPAPAREAATSPAAQWGVRVVTAGAQPACPAARERAGKEFPLGAKPSLPLPECAFPSQCKCSYVKLYDRRTETRRSGQDRRVNGHRLAEGAAQRRSGRDRRGDRVEWL